MKKTRCRMCKSENLLEVLDLGYHPHSDQFRNNIDDPEEWYPLRVNRCSDCGFVQLSFVVSPETMYQKDYLYESSITKTANAHWEEFADTVWEKAGLENGSIVLDVGSNDGTLLSKFEAKGAKVLGVDPCAEVADIAHTRGIPTKVEFFTEALAQELRDEVGPVDLITGTNVFAHIDDLDDMIEGVKTMLAIGGAFVFESPYLPNLLDNNEYDTIYHQHLSYLSVAPVSAFLNRHGLEIYDVQMVDIHGGCFRVFINRKGDRPVAPIVKELITKEKETLTLERFTQFRKDVERNKEELFNLVNDLHKQGKKIVAVSAPAKGQTLLNYTGIGRFLSYATERSRLKIGRFTPGTHLPIVPDSKLIEEQPDVAIVLAWNFANEIIKNNPEYKGLWIIPIPFPRTVTPEAK